MSQNPEPLEGAKVDPNANFEFFALFSNCLKVNESRYSQPVYKFLKTFTISRDHLANFAISVTAVPEMSSENGSFRVFTLV